MSLLNAKQAEWLESCGQRMRRLRLAFGYENQRHWISWLGPEFTYQGWNNYENDRSKPNEQRVRLLRVRTGVTGDWIHYGDEAALPHGLQQRLESVRLIFGA